MLGNKLLEILVCPLCKAKLDYDKKNSELICNKCKLAYPIDEDIPVMLIESARKINDGE
ncbi:MAG: Trm112 family protein [Neisseriaceae bacterium]|jgi:uncharacterized protein YbaR (Trm112 family)